MSINRLILQNQPILRPRLHQLISKRRFLSDKPQQAHPSTSQTTTVLQPKQVAQAARQSTRLNKIRARLEKINARLPRFLQPWIKGLIRAPTSHVVAFLFLHELTAVIPLFGLFGVFHYTHWLPAMTGGTWLLESVEKLGKYGRKKGWLKDSEVLAAEVEIEHIAHEQQEKQGADVQAMKGVWNILSGKKTESSWQNRDNVYGKGEFGMRTFMEFATAYAIVKMLFWPRIAFSAFYAPGFARIAVEPGVKKVWQTVWGAIRNITRIGKS